MTRPWEQVERAVRAARDDLEIAHGQGTGGSAAWEVAKRLTELLDMLQPRVVDEHTQEVEP
ncbi:MAG: hypothetical protein WC683_09335 [bacterium]|jgi:hypothetical protein